MVTSHTMTAPPLPTTPVVDWVVVWEQLKAGEEPMYIATAAQARKFHGWAAYHHKQPVYYVSVGDSAENVKKFSLKWSSK